MCIRVWSPDDFKLWFITNDLEAVKAFMTWGRYAWLPVVFAYESTRWQWSGRLELKNGRVEARQHIEYLRHVTL